MSNILILTPIEIEFLSIRQFLYDVKEVWVEGNNYVKGVYKTHHKNLTIILKRSGSKNNEIALVTQKAIIDWKPGFVFLLGIAGGVKDVNIGDIVIATKAYGYESGKYVEKEFLSRPEVWPYDPVLISHLESFVHSPEWAASSRQWWGLTPKIFLGPIASGDKVVASKQSEAYSIIKKYYNDTLALEMEATGFAKSVQSFSFCRAVNIRVISDLLDNKAQVDKEGNQEKVMQGLSYFFFEFLKQLDIESLNKQDMEPKKLAGEVVKLLFPLLKLDSIKQIGKEFKSAVDGSIEDLWKIVKPWFIEEIEDADNPEEAKGAVKSALKKKLEADHTLKEKVEQSFQGLQNTPKTEKSSISMIMKNSTNSLQGNNISVGGDLNMGDKK